jgi:hypothetical protein
MAQPNNDQSIGTPIGTSRLTVPDAAQALGISPEAVRNRLSRGTLGSIKENGRVFVLIDRDMARDTADQSSGAPNDIPVDTPPEGEAPAKIVDAKDETIRVLKDQLEAEREANHENRRIIAGLVQRVPELEASPEPRESDLRHSEDRGNGDGRRHQP